jgi:toxin ParE1/3/4
LPSSRRSTAYRVKIARRAESDLAAIYVAIDADQSDAAFRWFLGLKRAVSRLRESPRSCPATPEDEDLRHLLYGRKPHVYRVIYRIVEARKVVEVLHVRHAARGRFHPGEL